jgi:hypothetical protein
MADCSNVLGTLERAGRVRLRLREIGQGRRKLAVERIRVMNPSAILLGDLATNRGWGLQVGFDDAVGSWTALL